MLKRPALVAIVFIVLAIAAGLALFQTTRRGPQADDVIRDLSAEPASGSVQRLDPSACASAQADVEPPIAASGAPDQPPVIRLDYAGAESLLNALERDSLSDADVDGLLRIPGVCAMVSNVTRFIPGIGVSEFREGIQFFVRAKTPGKYDDYCRLSSVWDARSTIRTLIAAIQTDEREIVAETLSQLERYRPDTGTLAITSYFVVGGVSDGFAFESDPRSFYANLVTADGDVNGVVLNMAHEAYHIMQYRAQARAGMDPRWVSADTMPPVERLFAGTLFEGTANYVVDPTRSTATGSNMDSARQRYRRNAEPNRIAENFARFDTVLMGLRDGRVTWDKAYTEGFTSVNDESFYFVGYEMAKALEQDCGRECIGRLFEEPPVEFFRRYVAICQKHPELKGHFSQESEAFISAYGTQPTK